MPAIKLTWSDNSAVEEGYKVYRSDSSMDVDDMPEPITVLGAGATEYLDEDVVHGETYRYRVGAFNGDTVMLSGEISKKATSVFDYNELMDSLQPLSWWKMDDASAPIVDSAGSYNGIIYDAWGSGAAYQQPPIRKGSMGSMGFGLVSGRASVTPGNVYGDIFNPGKEGTIIIWAKQTRITMYNYLMASWYSPDSGYSSFRLILGHFQTPANKNSQLIYSAEEQLNKVMMVAIRRDNANNKNTVFLNGVQVSEITRDASVQRSPAGLYFPAFGSWDYYGAPGYMSDVAVFGRPLSNEDILNLYEAGKLDE